MIFPEAESIIAMTLPSASRTSIGSRSTRTSSGVGLGADPIFRLMSMLGFENQLADAGEAATDATISPVKIRCARILCSFGWGEPVVYPAPGYHDTLYSGTSATG